MIFYPHKLCFMLASVFALNLLFSCDFAGDPKVEGRALKPKVGSIAPDGSDVSNVPPSNINDDETLVEIASSGGSFQLKNVNLLKNSVQTCVGPDMTKISSDMIIVRDGVNPPPGADGRMRFLLPTYKEGDDIVDAEQGSLVNPESGVRTSVVADSLTDTYLRSLVLIGDVVAHNCSISNPLCVCDTAAAAKDMLLRCAPSLDPSSQQVNDAAVMLGLICAEGPSGMRRAVSSIISSYAFALAR